MARKQVKPEPLIRKFIDFDFQNRTYQIDPDRWKVYRRFVEIETSTASTILSTWRSQHASA